jgi:hypothetical protein
MSPHVALVTGGGRGVGEADGDLNALRLTR